MRLKEFMQPGGRKYNDPFYDTTDQKASQMTGVPLDILRGVRLVGEKSNENQVSSAGAKGVYQFIPSVRNSVLKKYGVDAWDPNQSSLAAAYLLKENADRNKGDYIAAVREYHGGGNRKNWGPINQAYINRVSNFNGNSNYNSPDSPNSPNSSQYSNQSAPDFSQYADMMKDMQKGIWDMSDEKTQEFYKTSPELASLMMKQGQTQQEFDRNQKLDNERIAQEENKKMVEQQNAQLQNALLQKQQEKEQILSMVPKAIGIVDGSVKPSLMQEGGTVEEQDGVLSYNDYSDGMTKDTVGFYKDMVNAPWYVERLKKRGYDDISEISDKNNTLDSMKFNYQDKSQGKLKGSLREMFGKPTAHSGQGSFYSPKKNEVVFVDQDRYDLGISSEALLGHEISHGINLGMNENDIKLIEKMVKPGLDEHSSNPNEIKADMDSIRVMLNKKGLFDNRTGKFKTKDGKFDINLLKGLEEEMTPARLRQTIGNDNLKTLLDTLAYNKNTNNNQI